MDVDVDVDVAVAVEIRGLGPGIVTGQGPKMVCYGWMGRRKGRGTKKEL